MDFTKIFQTIISEYGGGGLLVVSILIVSIVVISIGLPLLINKQLDKNSQKITKGVSDGLITFANKLTDNINIQNSSLVSSINSTQAKLLDNQKEMLAMMIDKMPNTTFEKSLHDKGQQQRFDINNELNYYLSQMRIKYQADRSCILEFHNGGHNIGGLPFIKYDMVYEQINKDVTPIHAKVTDLPSSNIASIIYDLHDGTDKFKVYYPEDIEKLSQNNSVLYFYLNELNIKYIVYGPIYDTNNIMIGLCVLEYTNYPYGDNMFRKFIDINALDIHSDIAKISNLLDLKHKNE